jgi:hypothetical protein
MQNTELFQENFSENFCWRFGFFGLAFRVFRFGVFIFNRFARHRLLSFHAFDNLHFVGILSPKLILSPVFNIPLHLKFDCWGQNGFQRSFDKGAANDALQE